MAEDKAAIAAALNRLLELCHQLPEGLPQSVMEQRMGDIQLDIRAKAINILLQKGQLQLVTLNGEIHYKEQSREEATKLKGLPTEDLLVFQAIQAAQNDGIWTRDIKVRTNLQQPQVTKAIKNLEARKLIKLVPSLQKNRKIYMLAELKPSEKLTGGAWYTDQQFDNEFVNMLKQQCLQFVVKQSVVTLEQIANFIRKSGMTKDDLNTKNIKQIIDMLVLDGDVDEAVSTGSGQFTSISAGAQCYRASQTRMIESSGLTSVPCGVCPVIRDCTSDGIISPQTCVYYQEWLKF